MNPDDAWPAYLIAAAVLTLINALISAADTAAGCMPDSRLETLARQGMTGARRLARLRGRADRLLLALRAAELFLAMAVGYLCAYSAGVAAGQLGFSAWAGRLAGLVLAGLVFFGLGGMLPRQIAALYPEASFAALFPFLWGVYMLFAPAAFLSRALSCLALRLMGKDPDQKISQVTEEEIRQMVDAGEESGGIREQEMDMINNIFEFDDRTVSEVMTHRTGLRAAPETAGLDDLVRIVIESGHSRIPIYREDLDDIVGIVYAKSFLKYLAAPQSFDIAAELRKPLYVPETMRCSELFKRFKDEKMQIAVVVDEYGGTYGIVTMEDLLESIVGNMQDEFDNEDEEILQVAQGVYIFQGNVSPDEVEHALDISLDEDEEYDTLGGVLIDKLGHLPLAGGEESVVIEGVRFTVLESDNRRIARVLAEPAPEET
jgi:putative hemolysin